MDLLQTITLGIIQGVSEFIPISSSAHLIIIPWLFGWPPHSLTIDIALHAGTLLCILIYFRKTWYRIALIPFSKNNREDKKLLTHITLATLPGATIGFLGKSYSETIFRHPLLIAAALFVMGLLLWLGDKKIKNKDRTTQSLTIKDCLLIGIAQGFAIIPGFSRSGTTIAAGLALRMKRSEAARFSFLLSAPIILGATLLEIPKMIQQQFYLEANFWWGTAVAFLVGYACITLLLKYVANNSYLPFVIYRVGISALILGFWLGRYYD